MYCKNCGKEVKNSVKFCPFCGQSIQNTPEPFGDTEQSQSGEAAHQTQNFSSDPSQGFQMKWYKFVVYFQLFFSSFISVVSGIQYFTGSQYGSSAYMVYRYYGGLKILDITMGILFICIAVFAIYTRQLLRHYKKQGPTLYLTFLAGNTIVNLAYMLIASAIVGTNQFNLLMVLYMIVLIVLIGLNSVYFQKRKSLFIN